MASFPGTASNVNENCSKNLGYLGLCLIWTYLLLWFYLQNVHELTKSQANQSSVKSEIYYLGYYLLFVL